MPDIIDADMNVPIRSMSHGDLIANLIHLNVELVNHHIADCKKSVGYMEPKQLSRAHGLYGKENIWQDVASPTILAMSETLHALATIKTDRDGIQA